MTPEQFHPQATPAQFTNPVPQASPRRTTLFVSVTVLLLLSAALVYAAANSHLGGIHFFKPVDPTADGRSNLRGGGASITYTTAPGMYEYGSAWTRSDGTFWGVATPGGDGQVELERFTTPSLGTPQAVTSFLAAKSGENADIAGFVVHPRAVTVNGYHGYMWDYISDKEDSWSRNIWFPGAHASYRLHCSAYPDARVQTRKLCAEASKSLTLSNR